MLVSDQEIVRGATNEMRRVMSSLESHEHDINGFAVDRVYSDTDRVGCVGSRERRAHWEMKMELECTMMTFFAKSEHLALPTVGFRSRQCLDEYGLLGGSVRYLTQS